MPNTRARARPEAGRGELLGGGGSLSWLGAEGRKPEIAVQVPQPSDPYKRAGCADLASVQLIVIEVRITHTRS